MPVYGGNIKIRINNIDAIIIIVLWILLMINNLFIVNFYTANGQSSPTARVNAHIKLLVKNASKIEKIQNHQTSRS